MAKRFIRWILPLLLVLTIAIAFMVASGVTAIHAAAPTTSTHTVSAPAKTSTGLLPNAFWRP
jgi:hypothetical protein